MVRDLTIPGSILRAAMRETATGRYSSRSVTLEWYATWPTKFNKAKREMISAGYSFDKNSSLTHLELLALEAEQRRNEMDSANPNSRFSVPWFNTSGFS